MRSFAIDEPGSSVRALYATLVPGELSLGCNTTMLSSSNIWIIFQFTQYRPLPLHFLSIFSISIFLTMNIGHVCHPNQGSECLGCLHSCWSPLSPHGPQARVRPSNGKISTLTFMSHLHKYHEDNHQNEKIHFQQTLSFSSHREGLPLTMKSCFYPLIGDRIFGWPGDLVDIIRFR